MLLINKQSTAWRFSVGEAINREATSKNKQTFGTQSSFHQQHRSTTKLSNNNKQTFILHDSGEMKLNMDSGRRILSLPSQSAGRRMEILSHTFTFLFIFLTISNNIPLTTADSSDSFEILPGNYQKDVAPILKPDEPVRVKVSVIILSMSFSSGSEQVFDVDIFYHNRWKDPRLLLPTHAENASYYKISHSWSKKLWVPDTIFRNAHHGAISNILSPTYYFTVTNRTEVFMAVRLSLKLTCEMDFLRFPFDSQTCFFNITSSKSTFSS